VNIPLWLEGWKNMENRLNYKYKFNHNPEYYFEHHLLAADFYD